MKPTIIFVPGAWHTPEPYDRVRSILEKDSFPTTAVTLPSVGGSPPCSSFAPDVQAIQMAVKEEVESGKDVILVMHSYGGIAGSDGLKGLSSLERQKLGKKGGVKALVYLCAFVLPEGISLHDAVGGKDPHWWNVQDDMSAKVFNPANIFYNDLPPAEAQYWVDKLQDFSYGCFKSPVTYAAWKYIPSTFLLCENDNAGSAEDQEKMVQAVGVLKVERCFSSHSPFLSVPEKTAEVIRKAAEE